MKKSRSAREEKREILGVEFNWLPKSKGKMMRKKIEYTSHYAEKEERVVKEKRRRERVQGAQRVLERRREGKCLEWLETFLLGRRFRRRKNHRWGAW